MTALRILHVDDEPDIRDVVEFSLGLDPDLVTRGCGSGQEALAVAVEWSPDLILLDVMMPGMDGPATLARLRDNAKTASIPVVFMTARAQSREVELFRSLGAVGVIPKPFDPMTFAASVRSHIRAANEEVGASRNAFGERVNNVFLQRVNNDAAALARHRSALKDEPASPATLAAIRDIAHGLAGAGGIFGLCEIGDAAAALEEAVILALDGSGPVDGTAAALDFLLARLQTDSPLREEASIPRLDA
jgi:CheY-like chemotaxis protein